MTRGLFCKYRFLFLAFPWLCGSFLGFCFVRSADDVFLTLLHRAVYSPVSAPCLIACVYLPFLVSAFAVHHNFPILLFFVFLAKSFSVGCVFFALMLLFGNAYWMAVLFVLFCDVFTNPLLFYYGISGLSGGSSPLLRYIIFWGPAVILTVDLLFISPFWLHLTT